MKVTRSEILIMLWSSIACGFVLYLASGNIVASVLCCLLTAACMVLFYFLALRTTGIPARSEVLGMFSSSLIAGFIFYWQSGNVLHSAIVFIITAALMVMLYYLAFRIWKKFRK